MARDRLTALEVRRAHDKGEPVLLPDGAGLYLRKQTAPLDSDASKFAQLRPVTFHLKTDPEGTPQYGLIAEEVNKLYPDLVIRGSSGTIQGVRYDEITSLLLAQMQLMEKKQQAIATQVELLAEQNKLLQAQLEALSSSTRLAAQ